MADPVVPTWPPTLEQLKVDMRINDQRDDETLAGELAAVVAYVDRTSQVDLYGVGFDAGYWLGAMRLAARQHARRRSPDGMVASLDQGTSRIGTGDSDIDKMLRIGKFARPVIA